MLEVLHNQVNTYALFNKRCTGLYLQLNRKIVELTFIEGNLEIALCDQGLKQQQGTKITFIWIESAYNFAFKMKVYKISFTRTWNSSNLL